MARNPLADYQRLNKSVGDETTLTDEELKARLGEYQGIQGYQDKQYNRDKLVNEIAQRFRQFGGRGPDLMKDANNFADIVIANNQVPEYFMNPGAYKGSPGYGQGLSNAEKAAIGIHVNPLIGPIGPGTGEGMLAGLGINAWGGKQGGGVTPDYLLENPANIQAYQIINSLVKSGYFQPDQIDVSGDIKRLQGAVGLREKKASANAAQQDYLNQLPSELAKGTNAYLQGQQERGAQYLEEQLAPEIAQSSNVRGLLYSGDLASELSRGAYDIQGQNEAERAQLESQDRDFYTSAAYNFTLNKALKSGEDVNLETTRSREESRQGQEYRFQAGQANKERQLQEKLLAQQQQRALFSQRDALKRQQDALNSKDKAANLAGIGQSIGGIGGSIIGAIYGGGAGAAVGGAAGSSAGNTTGQIAGQLTR